MASERAKELAAKQKAEAKAAKLAKKNSDDPKDWGTVRQLRESYTMVVQANPAWRWLLVASVAGPIVLGFVIGWLTGPWLYGIVLGVLLGITVFLFVLGRLVKLAAYKRYEGQPGQAQVALMMLTGGRKPKWSYTAAIAANREGDSIHRVIGPGGLILIGDGNPARLAPMMNAERRRHEQLLYDVTVQTMLAGDAEGEIPVPKLAHAIEKLPKSLNETQIVELGNRIKALDAMRGRAPVPKGPMPSLKGVHKAVRGR
ncbi:MAG: DUF4191 domain-containing protein [Actinomycetia bacterium]|nr:DUF4191 domain-containing protein [Actinomycetes bacterium]